MKSIGIITADIRRSPREVFARLTDLRGLAGWLGASGTYRGTADVSDGPVAVGTTYTDHIPGALVYGRVLEHRADELVVFRQATRRGALAITIRYELSPTPTGTTVVRTGEISTRGLLALLHPVVARVTARENVRTMDALRRNLEDGPA